MSSLKINEWKKMYDREKVVDYLPIIDYNHKNKVWITNDGGFGLVFECNPLIYSSKNASSALLAALQVLPQDAYVQVLLLASPNITNLIDTWESYKTRDDSLSQQLAKYYKGI